MVVIPREVCRETEGALAHEWLVGNGRGSYAAASISGALTRRQHGLLVAQTEQTRMVLLARIDEEVELDGHMYKLGANEYTNNVISPDGFLYLGQVVIEGGVTTFDYSAGAFELSKSVWMDDRTATTFIRYTLSQNSQPVRLTLLLLCDYRTIDQATVGNDNWHFKVEPEPCGIALTAHEGALPYRILTDPLAVFTPLDLWYWRFRLRSDANQLTDLFVPGLLRAGLMPGEGLTVIATTAATGFSKVDAERARERALQWTPVEPLPAAHEFTAETFFAPHL
jgi:predicted glycogen debranching enzyme